MGQPYPNNKYGFSQSLKYWTLDQVKTKLSSIPQSLREQGVHIVVEAYTGSYRPIKGDLKMKKFRLICSGMILLLIIASLLLTGCQGLGYTTGSGNIETKQYDLKDFDSIEISNSFLFEVKQSSVYSVSVSCRKNITTFLDVYVTGQTLVVRLKPGMFTNGDLKATISLPQIHRLQVSGASHGSIRGFKSSNDLDLSVSGASQLDTDIEASETSVEISGISKLTGKLQLQKTRFSLSGASSCDLNGKAGDVDLEVSGASTANLKEFPMNNLNINVSGASTAVVKTDGTLNLDVSGASTLEYYGNPTLSKVSVTGASKIAGKS
jgi:hypothetical protein